MYWAIFLKHSTVAVENMCLFCVSGVGVFFQKDNPPFLHIKKACEYLGNLYMDPWVDWLESKKYIQYPSNITKCYTSDYYWIQNNLLFNIPFCVHNNLKTFIKIYSDIYLSLAVLFPSVPSYWHHEYWVHKTRNVFDDTSVYSTKLYPQLR